MESDTCFLSKAGFQNPNTTLSCLCYADFMSDTSAVCNTEVHISAASVNKLVIITVFLSTVFTKSPCSCVLAYQKLVSTYYINS